MPFGTLFQGRLFFMRPTNSAVVSVYAKAARTADRTGNRFLKQPVEIPEGSDQVIEFTCDPPADLTGRPLVFYAGESGSAEASVTIGIADGVTLTDEENGVFTVPVAADDLPETGWWSVYDETPGAVDQLAGGTFVVSRTARPG